MKKVFYFDAPREKYHCDAAILGCFDNRFELGFRKFLKRVGVVNSDPIKIAGGAKVLASPERESEREFVLEQIRKSIGLHSTKRNPDAALRLWRLWRTRRRISRQCCSRGSASRAGVALCRSQPSSRDSGDRSPGIFRGLRRNLGC